MSIFFIPRRSQRDIVLALSVCPFRPSVRPFCLSGTISQYLLVRFDSFLVQMISTMDSRYPISLVKIDLLTLELLPLFSIGNYKAKPILAFLCDDLHISSKLLYLTNSHYRPWLPSACRWAQQCESFTPPPLTPPKGSKVKYLNFAITKAIVNIFAEILHTGRAAIDIKHIKWNFS